MQPADTAYGIGGDEWPLSTEFVTDAIRCGVWLNGRGRVPAALAVSRGWAVPESFELVVSLNLSELLI